MNQMQQPQMMFGNQPMNRTTQQEILTIDLVNGESAVYSFYVAPGVTAFLVDFANKKFYIKAVDFRGVPQPIRIFPFEEQLPQTQQPSDNPQINQMQTQIDELKQLVLTLSANQKPPQNNKQRGNDK